jgi:hypothetical protein
MDGGQADVCQAIPSERINRAWNYQQQFVHKKIHTPSLSLTKSEINKYSGKS